jgi:hypothetical protein
MKLHLFLAQKRQDVLRQWRQNQISLVLAAQRLVALGMSPTDAWDLLERT